MKKTLTKRNYLGEGYVHRFIHNVTGDRVFVPCTKVEYESLGGVSGHLNNPVLTDHTWECSEGGTAKVDTPNETLGEDEYCVMGEQVVVRLEGVPFAKQFQILPATDVTEDEIEIKLWQ